MIGHYGAVFAAVGANGVRAIGLDVGEAGEKWTKAIQGLFILLAVITDTIVSRRPENRDRSFSRDESATAATSEGSPA